MSENQYLGKKVFFLYPPSVIKERLIEVLVFNEFEVYTLKDHTLATRVFQKFNNSIVFINIDEGQTLGQWEQYIQRLLGSDCFNNIQVGIVTYNNNEALKQKYLMDIGVQCGFIQLKLGFEQSRDIILKVLEANEARGRRKYIRVDTSKNSGVKFNAKLDGRIITGNILDISSFGMSCTFDSIVDLKKNMVIPDLQLQLKGILVTTVGIVFGGRIDEKTIYLIVFDHRKQPINKKKIQGFIMNYLQDSVKEFI